MCRIAEALNMEPSELVMVADELAPDDEDGSER
jgi:hypothetical protein